MRYVELSHTITDGLVTYPGLPPPIIGTFMSFEDSHEHYAAGTEFQIAKLELVANTGTYLDTPAHRHRGATDLGALSLERIADVAGVVIRCADIEGPITPDALGNVELSGRAVLFHTGWAQHWGTDDYYEGHPHLGQGTVEALVAGAPSIVGIDSLNIDGTDDGNRPAHSALLGAGIPIVEHMTGLDELPDTGFRFFATPPRVVGMATFPVRAFALVPD